MDRELLRNIGEGLSNSEIVEAMNLFLSTVKSYVSRLLKKLNAWDRSQPGNRRLRVLSLTR